jgi:hypothetical protein
MRAWAALAAAIVGACALPAPAQAATRAGPDRYVATGPTRSGLFPPVTEPVGWRPLFATDFSGSSLPPECVAYEGPQGGVAVNYYRPDEVTVSGGVLHLGMRRLGFKGRPFTSGGVGCRQVVQTYGRYEFRAKTPLGVGIDSFITLWPAEAGHDKDATLVEILPRPGDEKAYLTNQYGSGSTQVTVPGSFSADFHTYTIEWTPTFFRVLVDGSPRMTDSHVSSRGKWIGFAVSSGDRLTGVPDPTTRLPAEFQVDWLRVYAYDPVVGTIDAAAPTVRPGVDAGPPTTSGTAVGRFLVVAFTLCATVAGLAYTVVWYARLRARRRLRPAHRA